MHELVRRMLSSDGYNYYVKKETRIELKVASSFIFWYTKLRGIAVSYPRVNENGTGVYIAFNVGGVDTFPNNTIKVALIGPINLV